MEKWVSKVLLALTFGVYIRSFMEMYLLIIIAVLSELNELEIDGTYREVSILLSITVMMISGAFV